jgi:mxaL protein
VDADVRWKAAVAALAMLLPIYGGLFKRYLNRAIKRV